ncbi:MAG: hypothetical protein AAGM38_00115 [Pseudomonadota bacterium]
MRGFVLFIGWVIWSVVALLTTLVLEVMLAMLLYVYLDLNHREFFGVLVSWARDGMNFLLNSLQGASAELYNAANQSLAGEVAAKAFLLLVLGLFASGVIRMLAWSVRRVLRARE